MAVVDDLRVAKSLVEKGWTKGTLSDDAGNVCAMGAVAMASGMVLCWGGASNTDWDRHRAQYEALMKHIPESFFDVAQFNDAPETTKQDVLNLFEKALAELGGMAA